MDNATLQSLGLDDFQRALYWQSKAAGSAHNKADSDKGAVITQFNTDITDLNTIIGYSNPSEAQQNYAIQRLAQILKDVLMYHKDEVT